MYILYIVYILYILYILYTLYIAHGPFPCFNHPPETMERRMTPHTWDHGIGCHDACSGTMAVATYEATRDRY